MRPIFFFFLILCFSRYSANAQGTSYAKSDSSVVFDWISKADNFFIEGEYDSALLYCKYAEDYSRQKKFKKGEAHALIEAAEILIDKDELDKADINAVAVNKIGSQIRDSFITAVSWMQMAQVRMYKGQYDEAVSLFGRSLQYYLAAHPTRYTALAFNDLGYTWGIKGELSKKANCLIQAISIYENNFPEEYGELGVAFNNLSTVYYELNQMDKAIEYAKKSLVYREKTGDVARLSIGCCNISQFYTGINNQEAERYLQLCVKYATQSNQEARIIHSYVTASKVYAMNKKPAEALEYELKAISLLEKSGKDPAMLANRYVAAGILGRQLNKDSAFIMTYFKKSADMLHTQNNKTYLRDYYFQLSGFYYDNKNYAAAYDSYRKYISYRDSVINQNTKSAIAEITTRYETEKKDNEISRLNADQRIKQLEIEKQKAIIAGNAAMALQKQNEIDLLSKSQELQVSRIKQQSEELEKQQLLATTNEQRLQLTEKENLLRERQLKTQKQVRNLLIGGLALFLLLGITYLNRYQLKKKLEQQNSLQSMRNSISQDLHDDIGASLSNINILNELAKRNINTPEKSKDYLSKASEDIQRISESLSDIVWNINPRYDDLQNLFIRMKRYAADMLDGKNINGHFDFPGDDTAIQLSMTQRRDLYLIFKEAVNNLVKYSGAKNATIRFNADKHKISMAIEDDGRGFDNHEVKQGNGLRNMVQRAKASNGAVSIDSSPGRGTVIRLEMNVAGG